MAYLTIQFRPNTNPDWVVELLKSKGLELSQEGLNKHKQFMLLDQMNAFYVLIYLSDGDLIQYLRDLRSTSSQIIKVEINHN